MLKMKYCPIVENKKGKKTFYSIAMYNPSGSGGSTSLSKPISNPSDYGWGTVFSLLACSSLYRAEICCSVLGLRQVLNRPASTGIQQ